MRTPPIAVPPPILAAPSSKLDVRRFDGLWTVTLVCPRSSLPGWAFRLVGKVSNGVFRGLRGEEGKPGGQVFDGTIEPDGAMTIFVKGLSGDSRTDPFHRPKGTEFHYAIQGRLEGSKGTATRVDRGLQCEIGQAMILHCPLATPGTTADGSINITCRTTSHRMTSRHRYLAGRRPGTAPGQLARPPVRVPIPPFAEVPVLFDQLDVSRQPKLEHGTFRYVRQSLELPAVGLDDRSANG